MWVCNRWVINIKSLCCFLQLGYAFMWLFDFLLFWGILVVFCFNFWGWRFLWWCFWLFCSICFRICSGSLWVCRFRFSFVSAVRAGRWVTRPVGWQIIERSFAFEWKLYRKWSEIYNFIFSDGCSLRELDEGRWPRFDWSQLVYNKWVGRDSRWSIWIMWSLRGRE